MARGWGSKLAEGLAGATELSHNRGVPEHSPDPVKLEMIRKKENLLLSRTRVLRELETVQNPRYRAQLSKALADLEAQLAKIS